MIGERINQARKAAGLSLRATPLTQQALLAIMSMSLILFALYLAGFTPFVRAIEAAGGTLWRHIQPHSRRFLPADSAPRAFGPVIPQSTAISGVMIPMFAVRAMKIPL